MKGCEERKHIRKQECEEVQKKQKGNKDRKGVGKVKK